MSYNTRKNKECSQLFLFSDESCKKSLPNNLSFKSEKKEEGTVPSLYTNEKKLKNEERTRNHKVSLKKKELYFLLEGGVHEVGGNKLFLVDGNQRIGIDFGHSYSVDKLYFNRPLSRPSNWNPLPILTSMKRETKNQDLYFLPHPNEYPGLYRTDLIEMAREENYDFIREQNPFLEALFLSHPHFDHYGSIDYLNENTLIYSGELAFDLIKSNEEISNALIGNMATETKKHFFSKNERENIKKKVVETIKSSSLYNELIPWIPLIHKLIDDDSTTKKNYEEIKKIFEEKIKKYPGIRETIKKISSGIAGVVFSVCQKMLKEDKTLQQKLIATLSMALNQTIVRHYGSQLFDTLSPLKEEIIKRKWNFFKDEEKIKIYDFEILPLEVSHQVLDSYAFIIFTRNGTIGYLSDFRYHGQNVEKTERTISKMKEIGIDYLFVEFTRAREDFNPEMSLIIEKMKETIHRSQGLVIVDVPLSNNWEFFFQYKLAKENGKKICISPRFAHILSAINGRYGFPLPNDENILILKRRRGDGSYETYREWEEYYYSFPNSVSPNFVGKNQKEIVLIGGYSMVNTIFTSIKPNPRSIYIRPFRTGLDSSEDIETLPYELQAERLISLQRMEKWLRTYKILWEEKDLYLSGHASSSDVIKTVKEIKPKYVIPIHTEHPEYFETRFINEDINVINPLRGKKYYI